MSHTPMPTPPPEDLLDAALRRELRWEAPPELTERLLQLVPSSPPVVTPLPRWRFALAIVLIGLTVLLSIVGMSYVYQVLLFQFGLEAMFSQLEAMPDRLLQMLYDTVPFTRDVISLIALARDQLHWLLLALVLWVLLDSWQPELRLSRRNQ